LAFIYYEILGDPVLLEVVLTSSAYLGNTFLVGSEDGSKAAFPACLIF
jgi:hypothetical protein